MASVAAEFLASAFELARGSADSPPGALLNALPLVAIGSGAFVVFYLLSLLLYFVSFLIVVSLWPSGQDASLGRFAAATVVNSGITLFASLLQNFVNVFVASVSNSVYLFAAVFAFVCFASLFHVVYLYAGGFATQYIVHYNAEWGPLVEVTVHGAISIAQKVLAGLVPLYNLVAYVTTKFFFQSLRVATEGNLLELTVGVATALGNAGWSFAESSIQFLQSTSLTCEQFSSSDDSCLLPQLRELDLVTPLYHLRFAVVHVGAWMAQICPVATVPFQAITYPLTDLNLARALHYAANSVLQIYVNIPLITIQRCHMAESGSTMFTGGNMDARMCFPDAAPAFNYMAEAVVNLGRAIDNTLDVVGFLALNAISLQGQLEAPTCADPYPFLRHISGAGVSDDAPDVFGGNRTTLVGLTPGLFAISDGFSAEYVDHNRFISSTVIQGAFQEPVDIQHGLAAVTFANNMYHDAAGDDQTGILGCRCEDIPLQVAPGSPLADAQTYMKITCGIALYDPLREYNANGIVETEFEMESTSLYMTCSQTKISVQSVRYPSRRFTTPTELLTTGLGIPGASEFGIGSRMCSTASTCNEVDAIIFVMPLCSVRTGAGGPAAGAGTEASCLSNFARSSCYPFCTPPPAALHPLQPRGCTHAAHRPLSGTLSAPYVCRHGAPHARLREREGDPELRRDALRVRAPAQARLHADQRPRLGGRRGRRGPRGR